MSQKHNFQYFQDNNIPLFEVASNEKKPKHTGWQNAAEVPKGDCKKFSEMVEGGSNLGAALPEGIIVLDFDKKNGGLDSLAKLNSFLGVDLLETAPSVRTTSGGAHIFFRLPNKNLEFRRTLDLKLYPGVDLQRKGFYVLIPPSTINGSDYSWHPNSVDEDGVVNITLPLIPEGLIPLIQKDKKGKRKKSSSTPSPAVVVTCDGAINGDDAKVILDHLDVTEFRNRPDWINLMMALHSATGGDAKAGELFVNWSASDEEYADQGFKNQHQFEWNSMNPEGGIGPATLIHIIQTDSDDPEDAELTKIAGKIRRYLDVNEFDVYSGDGSVAGEALDKLFWLRDERNWTDNGLARQFVEEYKDTIRYSLDEKKWFTFDGKRWFPSSETVLVGQKARKFVTNLWEFLKQIGESWPLGRIAKLTTFIRQSNSTRGIEQMIKLARCDSRILAIGDYWDQDETLLNVKNGTLDLGSGKLRPHDPNDHISLMANVTFDANADCPKWNAALDLIFAGNTDLIEFIQRLLGYCMSGDCNQAIFPIFFGPKGENGKSTIGNVIHELLGEYSYVGNETLLLGTNQHHPTELAAVKGKRLVFIHESENSVPLKAARMKSLTGDRTITARGMNKDFSEFQRTSKFILTTNHLPSVSGGDEGVMRRLAVVHFGVKISDCVTPDPKFIQKLIEGEGPGIINWCAAGFQKYLKSGLVKPECVQIATKNFQTETDDVARFLSECCIEQAGTQLGLKEGFERFDKFSGGFPPLNEREFSRRLGLKFEKKTARSGLLKDKTVFVGVSLKKDEKDEGVVLRDRVRDSGNSGSGTTAL